MMIMETLSVTDGFPHTATKGPVMVNFEVFLDVNLSNMLNDCRVAGGLRRQDAHVMTN